jgi:hypothetical protein
MRKRMKRIGGVASVIAAAAIVFVTSPAQAQTTDSGPRYQSVISANPFGILLEWFNAEYERVLTESTTVGVGGSWVTLDDSDYKNADVFWRFYLQDHVLEGWMFGAKAGVTNTSGEGTFFGVGFDFNRSWLMGRNDNFYVGVGFGLKRLFGMADDYDDRTFIPTIRLVNVGVAF